MKIKSGYFELNQYKWLVPVGLRVSHRDYLGDLHWYGYCVDSVDVKLVCSLFMGYFYSF